MESRALIIRGNEVLLIHRFKDGKEYFVIPGGQIESDETAEQALLREIREETNLDIEEYKRLATLKNPQDKSEQNIFIVTKFSGKLQLDGPELNKNSEKNRYILEWHRLKDLHKLNLLPGFLKDLLNTNS